MILVFFCCLLLRAFPEFSFSSRFARPAIYVFAHPSIHPCSFFSSIPLPLLLCCVRQATPRIGTRIGEFVLDLKKTRALLFTGANAAALQAAFDTPTLNAFMALGRPAWQEARAALQKALQKGVSVSRCLLSVCCGPLPPERNKDCAKLTSSYSFVSSRLWPMMRHSKLG